MISIVCSGAPGEEAHHLVLKVFGQPRKAGITLQRMAGAKYATQGLTVPMVLDSLKKPGIAVEFVKPAFEWVHFKLLKQVGLVDAEGNVLNLTVEMLRTSPFFSTESDVRDFREVMECGQTLKYECVGELNRKFLARFYRANGKCALLAKQRASLGIPKKFPYQLDDLLDITVPVVATSGNLKDHRKTPASVEKNVDAKLETLQPAVGRGLNGNNSGVISLGLPDGNEIEDLDSALNQTNEHVEIPMLDDESDGSETSAFQRARQIMGFTYIIILRVVSAVLIAGEYFHGTGGYIQTPNSDNNNEIPQPKRSGFVRCFIPTHSSWTGTWCKMYGAYVGLLVILMFMAWYVVMMVSHIGNGIFETGHA